MAERWRAGPLTANIAPVPFVVINENRGVALAQTAERAESAFARLKGLLGRNSLAEGSGLHIDPCDAIHTFFMQFSIDVVFLDAGGRAVHLVHAMPPWRATRVYFSARSVLELPPGTLSKTGTQVGDRLRFDPVTSNDAAK
jgi:uncharacterized protein